MRARYVASVARANGVVDITRVRQTRVSDSSWVSRERKRSAAYFRPVKSGRTPPRDDWFATSRLHTDRAFMLSISSLHSRAPPDKPKCPPRFREVGSSASKQMLDIRFVVTRASRLCPLLRVAVLVAYKSLGQRAFRQGGCQTEFVKLCDRILLIEIFF